MFRFMLQLIVVVMVLSLMISIALDHGDAVRRSIRLGLAFNDERDGPRSTPPT